MFISIGIDEDGRPYITTSDGSREKVVRKGKGKSVIDFPSTYTVLDIETTGLDPRYCEIIEISAMKYSSGQNIGTFSTYRHYERYVKKRPGYCRNYAKIL